MVSDRDSLNFMMNGPHHVEQINFGDGPVFMVVPLRYISVATIIREAKRRRHGAPDYLVGKADQ